MAQQKGDAVARRLGGQFVLSADTAVICGQRILPKAETAEEGDARPASVQGAVIVSMRVSVCICRMADGE